MQEDEVTIGEFSRFCKGNHFEDPLGEAQAFYHEWNKLKADPAVSKKLIDDYPATGVTHQLAERYAHEIGGMLPSEAQWEYAARSRGNTRLYVWGDDRRGIVGALPKANINNADSSCPSEAHTMWEEDRTEQGIHNLTGNVREWCRDVWWPYPSSATKCDYVEKPREGVEPCYVIRGGSFETPSETGRVTWRSGCPGHEYKAGKDKGFEDVGFRVVLEVLECSSTLLSEGEAAASRGREATR